ncbi:hypothetical protein BELL_2551g00010 [Botrytis elliptica]|uniref:Uncharacterized protein n=1 Tax=Botrytis elliptica TaxID=278938 RepID=A0A4Z1HAS9_9HELO|nr:hypothetical protein BELL_2551g00010 [Botrytis elliptica]
MQTPNIISADVAPQFYDSISDRYEKYYAQNQGLLDFVRESLELLPRDAEVSDGWMDGFSRVLGVSVEILGIGR